MVDAEDDLEVMHKPLFTREIMEESLPKKFKMSNSSTMMIL